LQQRSGRLPPPTCCPENAQSWTALSGACWARPVPDDPESDRVVVRIGGTEVLADLKSVIKEQTLEGRLARISELMAESSRLSDQISAELEARAATAKKLQQEADDAAQLAAINREQAEAVRRLLEADISEKLTDSGKAIERNVRRDAIRIGAASFRRGRRVDTPDHAARASPGLTVWVQAGSERSASPDNRFACR